MLTCPDGHQTTATDYCDVCGAALGGAVQAAAPQAAAQCPACGAAISGRFCEVCGHDSALPSPGSVVANAVAETVIAHPDGEVSADPSSATAGWMATIAADREFYERVLARKGPDAERVEFPGYYPERRISLQGTDFLIGKRSVSQGVEPDIDLGIAPVDIGVSRSHARIHLAADGLTVTDLGSTNGTSLNGTDDLIPPRTPMPLRSGDRIHVGGWTTITVTAEPG
ncbi:FHA domain-containing protein [Nocardia sp. NEAU-G5]|uniref:FHA domain-containing protein n=1 Tax=Nocardia albiluteola TaxID=2842303 RepID=A0ABS6ATH8_9NOCA|nr:FHA domain-containing protein [Nocardia albiluteola]MBU3061340.1 FHA domain-containing protein [Nocardia albiluteola]